MQHENMILDRNDNFVKMNDYCQWSKAVTLCERVEKLHSQKNLLTSSKPLTNHVSDNRFHKWRSQRPFTNADRFHQRLAAEGITEHEFIQILGEAPKETLSKHPDALNVAERIIQAYATLDSHILSFPPTAEQNYSTRFLYLIEPLINQGIQHLRSRAMTLTSHYTDAPFDAATVTKMMFPSLSAQLVMMLGRTLILELNIARLKGELQGNSSEERFLSFIERIQEKNKALAILQEYPVLARQVLRVIDQWVEASLEFLTRLCIDWEDIISQFSSNKSPGHLAEVVADGDTHRNRRTVLLLRFSSGLRLVYKPKPLTIDIQFQKLLQWLSDQGKNFSFRTIAIVDKEQYGWVEFVNAQSCITEDEIKRFYQRQGGYLALLYALQATDFHLENLIAAGEHPILIDLESLFHPYLNDGANSSESQSLATQRLANSVLRVGLLPDRMLSATGLESVEVSGLGGTEGQRELVASPSWNGIATDTMQVERTKSTILPSQNRPKLHEKEVNAFNYAPEIIWGFEYVYRLLMNNRSVLLGTDGLLDRFRGAETRVIIRATQKYGLLQQESMHPDLLRNALDRDRFFDRLWGNIELRLGFDQIIISERKDLWNEDVPFFTTRTDSCDLWDSRGTQFKNFFAKSGMTEVRNRIEKLSENDLTQQSWIIHSSMATLAIESGHANWYNKPVTLSARQANVQELIVSAREVGDRLAILAIQGAQNKDANWFNLSYVNEKYWTVSPAGLDLYSGLPGITLFLAYLSYVTKDSHYEKIAHAALITIRKQLAEAAPFLNHIGGFTGWGGLVYTFLHLGTLWCDPQLLSDAEEMVMKMNVHIQRDREFDIISGSAGCIGVLLALHHRRNSDAILNAAIACGDILIQNAEKQTDGIAWVGASSETGCALTGFSHGTAGIAWALQKLAIYSGLDRFHQASQQALLFERSFFSKKHGNWADLESKTTTNDGITFTYGNAWCHGAPGIGLGRLNMLPYTNDEEVKAELDVAVKTTEKYGFGMNHSLCHGSLGNLELLLQTGLYFSDSALLHKTYRIASTILTGIQEHGWQCGVPLGVETPGLMTGLAGIGYGLLRLAAPDHVPSVLTLEPPHL